MRVILAIIISAAAAAAQLGTTTPIRFGATLPATCSATTGNAFFKTTSPIGLHICTSANTWALTVDAAQAQTVTGAKTFTGDVLVKNLNAVRFADQFAGADWGAKVQAAIDDLPVGGQGTIDARGFTGAQAISSSITFGDRHVAVLLPCVTISGSGDLFSITTATNKAIRLIGCGIGGGASISSSSAAGRAVVASGTNTVELRDLQLTASVAKTSNAAVDVSGAGTLKMQNVTISSHYNGISIGGTRSNVEIAHLTLSNLANDGIVQDTTGASYSYRNIISNNSPAAAGAGFRWLNGNGVYMTDADFINFGNGVLINPSAGKTTQYGFFKGVAADNNTGSGFNLTGNAGTANLIQFVDCWAVTSGTYGFFIDGSVFRNVSWVGGKLAAGTLAGALINVSNTRTWIGGGAAVQNDGTNGILIGAGVSDWTVDGVVSGGGTQQHGIFIYAGASNNYSIINSDLQGNSVAALSDGGTGTNKQVYGNRPDTYNAFVGNLSFWSGQTVRGIFDHANTASDKTYTLPNATGNIPSLPNAATTETGSDAVVRATSPTITSPTLAGTPVIGDGAGNDKLDFAEEATNPTCAAGNYFIWANSGDAVLKKCQNGTVSNLDTTGGAPPWESLVNSADTATSYLSNNTAETVTFSFESAFGASQQFLIRQQTGNPTTGTLLDVRAADADVTVFKAGDGTKGISVSQPGVVTIDNATSAPFLLNNSTDTLLVKYQVGGIDKWAAGMGATAVADQYEVYSYTAAATALKIVAAGDTTMTALGTNSSVSLSGSGTGTVKVTTPGTVANSVTTIDGAQALTNKTLDAEGTGNVITLPLKMWFTAAGCDNATASSGLDLPTSLAPAKTCFGTSPHRFGALDFADGASILTSTTNIGDLPSDWTGAVDIKSVWFCSAGTCSTNNFVWTVATACVADTQDFAAPTYNTRQDFTKAGSATTNARLSDIQTGITMTGCAAGKTLFLRIGRDPTVAGDTQAGTMALLGFELTIRRAI